MKRLRKILCILLASIMVLSVFASCNKGGIIAIYDDIPVYESDVEDLTNYRLMTVYNPNMTDAQVAEIMRGAVKTYVQYIVLEIDLAEKGYVVDEKEVDERFEKAKKELDEGYGYKKWCKDYRVSKHFLKEEIRRYVLTDLFNEYAMKTIKVTDEEILEYYNAHALTEFAVPAGYYWTTVLREVLDINNEKECADAKAETQKYIDDIKAGKITMEDAKKEILAKYTKENGYTQGPIFSGPDFTSGDSMVKIETEEDLQAKLAELDKKYADRDATADKKSDAYKNHMSYLGEVFKMEVFYALQHMEKGEIYSEPIKSFSGYIILRLDDVQKTNEFVPLADVKNEIGYKIQSSKLGDALIEYMDELKVEYNISYIFENFA